MKRVLSGVMLTMVVAAISLIGVPSFAAQNSMPSGFHMGHKNGWNGHSVPPGWQHGKKNGWHGMDMPHGFSKAR